MNNSSLKLSGGAANTTCACARKTHMGGVLPFAFALTVSQVNRIVTAATSQPLQVLDTNVNRSTGATVETDFVATITPSSLNKTSEVVVLSTSTPSLLSSPVDGVFTYAANGSANIIAASASRVETKTVSSVRTVGQIVDVFQSFVDGSLAKAHSDQVDNAIAGKVATAVGPVFSFADHTNASYQRNQSCFAPHSALAFESPWNSESGTQKSGSLISPRHILFATHYQMSVGTTIRFIRSDGSVVNRTLTAKSSLPTVKPLYPDFTIGLLDSDVIGIEFCRILPSNFLSHIPSFVGCPVYSFDQSSNLNIREVAALVTESIGRFIAFRAPESPARYAFHIWVFVGDSGNPVFMVINGLPVLLSVFTYGNGGGGAFLTDFKSDVNNIMSQLGGGYQLQDIDLSGFPTFS